MRALFERYLNQMVGVNVNRALKIESCVLVAVTEEWFTLQVEGSTTLHHYRYDSIIHVLEDGDGVTVGGLFSHKQTYPLVIKVGHVVEVISG